MKIKKIESSVAAFLLLSCFSVASIAADSPDPQPDIADVPGNFVTNGNFEQVDDRVGHANGQVLSDPTWRGWEMYQALPGWFVSFGHALELQRGQAGINPPANGGGQVLEMDTAYGFSGSEAGNYWVSQNVTNLTPGVNYTLNFKYHRNISKYIAQGRGVAVYWGERIPGKNACNVSNTEIDGWRDIECNVTATASEMYLTFAGFGDENAGQWGDGIGGLIDVVTLVATP